MKKIILSLIFTTLPSPLAAMSAFRMQKTLGYSARLLMGLQKRCYSSFSTLQKPLGALSVGEVQKLASNKKLAQEQIKSALLGFEDTQTTLSTPSPKMQTLWAKTLSQFSIRDWHAMLLEREERQVLTTLDPNLPGFMKTVHFEEFSQHNSPANNNLRDAHATAKQEFEAAPLKPGARAFYQRRLQALGYPKPPGTIYLWNNISTSLACSIYPHIYLTPEFFELPLDQRLSVLAHEDQHRNNYHVHKYSVVASFLGLANAPDIYAQFTEKEADLKSAAYSLPIAMGLLGYLAEKEKKHEGIVILVRRGNERVAHPPHNERIRYMCDSIKKLFNEQQGYVWNPFFKTLGLPEWFKKHRKK